jgi:hypothetical protein
MLLALRSRYGPAVASLVRRGQGKHLSMDESFKPALSRRTLAEDYFKSMDNKDPTDFLKAHGARTAYQD